MPVTLTNPPYSGADQLWILGVSIDRPSRAMAIQWGVKKSGKLLKDFNSVVVLTGQDFTDFYEGVDENNVPNWETDSDLYTLVQSKISVTDLEDSSGSYTPGDGESP